MRRWIRALVAWDVRHSHRLARRLVQNPSPFWRAIRTLAVIGARAGDGLPWVVLGVIAYALGSDDLRLSIRVAVGAILLAGGVASAVKAVTRRERPPHGPRGRAFYYKRDIYAFPSGHASRMFCIAAIVGGIQPALQIPLWMLAFWVAASRVLLGVHHILDVVVGGILGLGVGMLARWLFLA